MELNFNKIFFKSLRILIFIFYLLIQLSEYYVLVITYYFKILNLEGWPVSIILIFYQILAVFKIICFMQTINCSNLNTAKIFPHIPQVKRKIPKSINYFIKEDLINSTTKNVKTCDICMTIKPPRAHHCKTCNKCYLKYDHHCTFLNVCIEFFNYKFFYQLIVIDTCQSIFFILVISLQLKSRLELLKFAFLIVGLCINGIKLLILLYLTIFHTILISRNETTVEWKALNFYINNCSEYSKVFQEGPISEFSENKNRKILNPYNLNIKSNWSQVFGKNIVDWISPTLTLEVDGISFPKNYRCYDYV